MKTVTLLAMAKDECSALEALREIGVMHLVASERISEATQSSADLLNSALRTKQFLEAFRADDAELITTGDAVRGREIIESAGKLLAHKPELESAVSTLKQRLERLAVWGDFRRNTIDELQSKGINVLLCSGAKDDFKAAALLENVTVVPVREARSMVDFAVIVRGDDAAAVASKLPVVQLAEDDDPAVLSSKYECAAKELQQLENELAKLACETGSVERFCDELAESAEFNRAVDAMSEHGEIAVLRGFVPVSDVEVLRNAAAVNGWGLLIADPADDEDVPVLLENNKFTRIVKPLFDFLGIAPGYREIDVSGGVLIFFALFYAIIIGDAGYGIVFAIAALLGLRAAKRKPALKLPMTLFLVLSVAATVWGALCGSWFGLSVIPGTDIPGLECFRDFASSNAKQANIQFFCFILAVLQLSVGHIWRVIRERNWRALGQHLGWVMIIWGNFFLTVRLIVYPGEFPQYMYVLYGAGLLLVVLFGVNWKNIADIFQFPFDIIGSFTDILSYIRLFAVGLAGACIAGSFNGMAFDVSAVSAWLIPAGVLVALAGHLLNIALAFLSVLVHAVRLNTLEFSNHAGLSWSGQSFNPFKKTYKDKE